ncbi:MAG TPA: CopD family protein [Alphaproteobacteria bacterium]|nr:CopD family protein [Alphaproteobacteria bacterium]
MSVLGILVRALHYASAIGLFGGLLYLMAVARPAARCTGMRDPIEERFVYRQARLSLALLVVSGALWLWLVAASIAGTSLGDALAPDVLDAVLGETRFGQIWLARCAGAALLAVLLAFLQWRAPGPGHTKARRVLDGAAFALALLLLASIALVGHAAAAVGGVLNWHLAADLVHITAAGAWLGSLAPLALLLARTSASDASALAVARATVARYSTLGIVSVSALAAGGIVNALYMVGDLDALIGTPYGRLVIAKILLLLAMLVGAARNYLVHAPRLRGDAAPMALARLRQTALYELALGVAVLLVVGALVSSAPATMG